MKKLTTVMYHYVRPIKSSQYNGIKGLELELFKEQLDYIERYYTPVTIEQCLNFESPTFPENAIFLTFDDGYIDHYHYVFPELKKRNMQGAFFPPSCTLDGVVLDVNKIHYILECQTDEQVLVDLVDRFVMSQQTEDTILTVDSYHKKFFIPNRYDSAKVSYIKHMLQHALPLEIRSQLVDDLFIQFVSKSEEEFAKTLYMSRDNLNEMIEGGMNIGGHSQHHKWLNTLPPNEQYDEIKASHDMVKSLIPQNVHSFCYPYGAYNDDTIATLNQFNFDISFTTKVDISCLSKATMLTIDRLDTNDLPKDSQAPECDWTKTHYGIMV